MNPLEKTWERILAILLFFAVPAILFLLLNEDVIDRRIATMTDEFVMEVTKDGVLTTEEYLIFENAVASMQGGYKIELRHQKYTTTPYYEFSDNNTIHNYFKERNNLAKSYVMVDEIEIQPVDTSKLKLQEQTNASVLASMSTNSYVPLPDDNNTSEDIVYEAVVPVQECYDGEKLVTVVKVYKDGMVFYAECDPVTVTGSGTGQAKLALNGSLIDETITVIVYPKTFTCSNGHVQATTKERIETYKSTGSYGLCDYCSLIPKSITLKNTLTATVGTTWEELAPEFTVTYMNGKTETIKHDQKGLYHDYDSNYCGTQTVTVSYKGFKTECFDITLTGRKCSCGQVCSERSYNDYLRFNYCDTCLTTVPFYFGDSYVQEDVVHHKEIAEILDNEGKYVFNRGDYLQVTLTRLDGGIPLPFMTRPRTIPIMSDGFIRTSGK